MSTMKWAKGLAVSDVTLVSSVVETPPAAYNGGTSYDTGDQASVIAGTVATVYESKVDANLGNAPASSPDEWDEVGTAYEVYDGGPYSLEDIVTDDTGHRLYQSLEGTNSAPLSDDTKWLDIGPTNRWAMFDNLIDTVTARPDEIRVEIPVTGRMDTLALLGVDATTVNVTMLEGVTEVYNQDFSMLSYAGINDYWEYFFNPIRRKRVLRISDLPIGVDPTLIVTITGAGDVSVGHMVFGYAHVIGGVQFGAQLDHNDFSRFETDAFGRRYIVKRTYRNRGRFNVWVARDDVDFIQELIAEWTGEPVLVIGSEIYDSSVFFGLLSDGRMDIDHATESLLTVKAENY
ncbi:MAG: hypothetical protein KUG65_13195 [Sphingomonadaceae bacterium]|nr:hypothetical protein [Sphingomonadaceae bacterium]